MRKETTKTLQELGCFILAGGRGPKRMKEISEMIRVSRDYRWVGIYKIAKKDFTIVAGTGDEPPTYPQFPVTQGLCGAAFESRKTLVVGDVQKDKRYLPTFHTTRSEIIVPLANGHRRIVGVLDVESDKVNAFGRDDRDFLEHVGNLLAHFLE